MFGAASPANCRAARIAILLVIPVIAAGQASRTTGILQVSVIDQTGSAIAGATIQLTNPATNQTRRGASDSMGSFLLASLPVGMYQLKVEAPNFAAYQNNAVEISVGSVTSLTIRLAPATVQQQVTVSEEPPPIDVTQTTVASTIGPERIEESPVVTRNYLNFVLLAPSLSQSSNPRSAATSSVFADSGFTFAGLRPRSNSLYIDGVENNDEFEGSVRTELSPETIHEFQVVNNGISAESGGGAGGSINVVTKSGANIHHGDAFLFIQNSGLNAKEPLTNEVTKPELDRERVGFALGGPIIRDRTFYYFAGEQERSRGDDSSLIAAPVAASINALLGSGAYPRLSTRQVNPNTFRAERAETEASGKIDHQITGRNSLLVKYAFTNNREVGDAFNGSGLVDPSGRGSSFTRDQGLTAAVSSIFSATVVNNAAIQVSRRTQVLRTTDQAGPGILIAGDVEFGRPFSGNSHRTEDHYQFLDAVSVLRGRHLLKVGIDLDHIHETAAVGDGFAGYYIFPSLPAFLSGTPDEYLQSWGNPRTQFGVTKYAGFLQDHWMFSKRLTIDAGMRYDFERLPFDFRQDTNNFAPRVGMAFSPSDKWVLRTGFGIFYDRYLLAAVNRTLQLNGSNAFEQVAYGSLATQIFNAALGGTPAGPVAGISPTIFTISPNLSTPYSEIASAGAQRLIARNLTISATYSFAHGVKLPRTVNVNLPPSTVLTFTNAPALRFSAVLPQQLGRQVFGPNRLNGAFDNIYQWQDESSSTYHGFSIALNRRLEKEIEFSANYTVSKALDDASDFIEQPQNPYDLRAERALSANDQRHRFVFSGTFDLPFGDEEGRKPKRLIAKVFSNITAAPILTIGSGRPINPLTGFDAEHSGAFPLSSRPLGFARNTLHTPNQVQLDLRVLKYFKIGEHGKLDLVAESFNLLNHTNVIGLNQFFGPGVSPIPVFGTPDRAAISRQLQFSIDFEF
jgi:Carboxypeptidase regulatory-like domain/TonB dependent receptor-like, beta-barrel